MEKERKWELLIRWKPSFISETKQIEFRDEHSDLKTLAKEGELTDALVEQLVHLIEKYGGDVEELIKKNS